MGKNDKKQYVVKNIVKSINLAALSIYSLPYIVYPLVMSQNLNNGLMHITGLFYSSGDFIALMYVKDLPSTTKNHHKVTVFFSFLSLGIDFNNSSLGKLLFVYTMASANAFIVNYHLGSRFLYDKEDTLYMKKKARDVYGLTLFFNWGWHVYWFITNFNDLAIEHFFYLCILYPIVKDDIILFSWFQENRKQVSILHNIGQIMLVLLLIYYLL